MGGWGGFEDRPNHLHGRSSSAHKRLQSRKGSVASCRDDTWYHAYE